MKLNLGKVLVENNIDSLFGEFVFINIFIRGKNYRYKKFLVKVGVIDFWVVFVVIVEEVKGEISI